MKKGSPGEARFGQGIEAWIEEVGAGKNPFCRHYDQCLSRAARRDVTFCCRGCAHELDYCDYEYDDFLPGQAIRKQCVECVGNEPGGVKNCGGHAMYGDQGDKNGQCWFYPYRMGRGRPSVKTIRNFCLECMGGSYKLVENCSTFHCPLYVFRFGTNPNYPIRKQGFPVAG